MPSLDPRSWIRSLIDRSKSKAEPNFADMAGIIIKENRIEKRIGGSQDFDFTDDEQVLLWAKKNIAQNLPFLRAGDKRDSDKLLRAYATEIHFKELLKDMLTTKQTFYRHKSCGLETITRLMPAKQIMEALADGSSVVAKTEGSVEYQFCVSCKKVVSPDEMDSWEVVQLKKPHYKNYIDSWNRTLAHDSIIVYGKSFFPEDIDSRPLVLHQGMPGLMGNSQPALGFNMAPGTTPAQGTVEQATGGGTAK